MRLGTVSSKIIFSQAVVLAVALLASAVAFYIFTAGFLTENARSSTRDAARLADDIIRRDIEQAALYSRLIAENYQVKVALEQAASNPDKSRAALKRQLRIELKSISADFLSAAREDGVVFAHESRLPVNEIDADVFENEPLFLSPVFQKCESSGMRAVGIEPVFPNTLAVSAVAPVMSAAGGVSGYVRLGYRLDQRFVSQIRKVTKTHAAVIHRGEIIAGTFPEPAAGAASSPPPTLKSLSRNYLLHVTAIRAGVGSEARFVTAYPKGKIKTIHSRIAAAIVIVALAAFAISFPVLSHTARVIISPLGDLMAGVGRVEDGDLDTRIPPCGSDEICSLAESFNRMTTSLKARDEEIRRSQDQLIESGKLAAIGELAAGVAHEIGNPLAAISGYIQLLKDNPASARAQHFLQEMEKEAGFIDSTIRELLNFARPSRTEEELVELNSLVDECLRMLSFHKAFRPVKVEKRLDRTNPCALGSRKELLQALLNLSLNAAQSMPEGGILGIIVESGGSELPPEVAAIRVTDTGTGMAREEISKIFDPFYTTKRGGTGLGLSITYRIVQRHQGEIRVESHPGRGSSFTVLLPLHNKANHQQI